MAGERGMGALGFAFVSPEAAQAWVNAYYTAYTQRLNKLCDYQTNPAIAVVAGFMCADTDEAAERMADGWTFFQFSLMFYSKHGVIAPGTISLWDEYQKWRQTEAGQKNAGGLIGSPETIREKLQMFQDANVDQVILLNQAGKNTHEDICSSLELFAQEVMPEFHASESEHQEWKQQVLAGDIVLEEIDTTPFNSPARAKPTKAPGTAPPIASGAL